MRVLSLLYHDVLEPGAPVESGFPGGDARVYKLDRAEFIRHLQALSARVRPGVLDVNGLDGQERLPRPGAPAAGETVLLTFDDGGVSAYAPTADLLEERGFRGYFFVTTDYVGKPGFLDAAQVRALRARGHVIGSHSCSHPPRMSHLDDAALGREWSRSAKILSDILGEAVTTASVPGGYYSARVARAAAAAGYRVLFNSEPTSRVGKVEGCMVLGRYSVQRGVPAERAAAMAAGQILPRAQQAAFWGAKKVLKAAGGSLWLRARKALLSDRNRMS